MDFFKDISAKQILNIALITLLLIFVLQNMSETRVKFLFFGFDLPLIILIVIVFFLGFFTAKSFGKKKKDDTPL